MPRGKL
jgi:hypothetical protein